MYALFPVALEWEIKIVQQDIIVINVD